MKTPEKMSDERLMKCIVAARCLGTVQMSFETGPYSVSVPSADANNLCAAIEAERDRQWIETMEGHEPVAWRVIASQGFTRCIIEREPDREQFDMGEIFQPLYTHPSPEDVAALKAENESLKDDRERLIEHSGAMGVAMMNDDQDLANESWRSLPDHLQDAINAVEQRIEQGGPK